MYSEKLNTLNCMNYHVQDETNDEYWYATNGLRSLYNYSKVTENKNFREICLEMIERQQVELLHKSGSILVLTMI